MSFTHSYHCLQNLTPGSGVHHNLIRKHAAVPADVPNPLRQYLIVAAQPATCMAWDIQLPVWIVGQAMSARFVVRS
jgi:hypothetical protein